MTNSTTIKSLKSLSGVMKKLCNNHFNSKKREEFLNSGLDKHLKIKSQELANKELRAYYINASIYCLIKVGVLADVYAQPIEVSFPLTAR